MKFVMLTPTLWSEPPRLRHQVARMLARRGHEVDFVERPGLLRAHGSRTAESIRLVNSGQLVHHQLRLAWPVARLNGWYVAQRLRQAVTCDADTVVLNFRYDYHFVRDAFPDQVILTVINDDFLAAARWNHSVAERALAGTLRASDATLVVSYPLRDQARQFTERVDLLLPWARQAYRQPPRGRDRNELLYWGFLNDRLDIDALRYVLDSGIVVNFAGPVDEKGETRSVLDHANARYHGTASLDELAPVVARCAASILPYGLGSRFGGMVAAITINNRAFDLLAAGLPLLYADLPELLRAPEQVIRRCRSGPDYVSEFERARAAFDDSQAEIASFLSGHTEDHRYQELLAHVAAARARRPVRPAGAA